MANVKAITEWHSRLKIEARRIQEKPCFGELGGGTITAKSTYVNNPLMLSLFLSAMTRKFIGLVLVS
jgi:hypothetical protein